MYSSFSSSVFSVKNKNQELSEYSYIAYGIHVILCWSSYPEGILCQVMKSVFSKKEKLQVRARRLTNF